MQNERLLELVCDFNSNSDESRRYNNLFQLLRMLTIRHFSVDKYNCVSVDALRVDSHHYYGQLITDCEICLSKMKGEIISSQILENSESAKYQRKYPENPEFLIFLEERNGLMGYNHKLFVQERRYGYLAIEGHYEEVVAIPIYKIIKIATQATEQQDMHDVFINLK